MRARHPLAALVLAAAVSAQGYVPPPQLNTFAKDLNLNPPNLPGTQTCQIHAIPHPAQPGLFLVAATEWSSLPAANGGVGGMDLFTGIYDPVLKKFTPDLNAAGLNSSSTEFGLMLLHNGLLAVFESNAGATATNQCWLASRPDLNSPFKILGAVAGVPTGNSQVNWDPALAVVDGKIHLLHMLYQASGDADIAMSDLDIVKLTLGRTFVIVKSPVAGQHANSPTPIVDSTGEMVALSFHTQDPTTQNDHWMAFDLDPNTAATLFVKVPEWINNGGFVAGTFYDAHYLTSVYQVSSVESAWWTGGRAAPGNPLEVSAYVPIQGPAAPPWVSFFLLARGFLAKPIAVPGVIGEFGLDPLFLLPVGLGAHNPLTGKAAITLPVPNDPTLKGLALPGQSISINPKGASGPDVILGNTAALTIK